jgi:chorismate-pyruvate lyase
VTEHRPDDHGPATVTVGDAGTRLSVALAGFAGTVTELLEQLVGEPIDADRRVQTTVAADADNPLAVEAGAPVVRRAAVLYGRTTGRAYVYAESIIAADRLPAEVERRLATSSDPIGRLLVERGLTVARTSLGPVGPVELVADPGLAEAVGSVVHARRYRIDVAGEPLMAISEWFLADTGRALDQAAAPSEPEP